MKNLFFALRYSLKSLRGNISRVVSITLGLALGLLAFSFIVFDLSYNSFLPDKERVYQFWVHYDADGLKANFAKTFEPVAPALKTDFPQIETATRFRREGAMPFESDKRDFEANLIVADTSFFEVLDLGVISGDPHRALAGKDKVMISESFARRLFGREDPVGKELRYQNKRSVTVSGVFRDVPQNSNLWPLDAILSDGDLYTGWNKGEGFDTYIKVKPEADPRTLEPELNDFFIRHGAPDFMVDAIQQGIPRFFFVPVTSTNLVDGNTVRMALIIGILALLIIFVSSMNYVLISVSMLVRHSKTIGTLKCNGAGKGDILAISLYETALLVSAALVLATVLIYAMRAQVETLTGIPVSVLFAPARIWAPLSVILLVFLLSSLIPALLFASVSVQAAFRNGSGNRRRWKQLLLAIELICVSFVTVFVLITGLQFRHMVSLDMGYQHDRLIYTELKTDSRTANLYREALRSLPEVEWIGMSLNVPLNKFYNGTLCTEGATNNTLFSSRTDMVDTGYLATMGIELVAGRNFTDGTPYDQVIVNELYAKLQGWTDDPVGKITYNFGSPMTVIGVIRDFKIKAVNAEVPPMQLHFLSLQGNQNFDNLVLSIRLREMDSRSIRAVEAKLKQVTPQVRFKFQIFDEQLTVERHYERAFRNTVTTVSLATLIIALMGLIGYVNDEIRRRTKEIAIRKVNGATARDIQRLILHDLSVITLPAILLGITSAYLFSREWLMRFNDRITLHWWIFAVGALFVTVIVACVALWQTHRSAHGDPIKMIRTE